MLNMYEAKVFNKKEGEFYSLEDGFLSACIGNGIFSININASSELYLCRSTNRLDRDDNEIFTGMVVEVYKMGLYRVDYNFYGDIVLIGEDRGDEIDLIKESWVSDYRVVGWWLEKGMK